MTVISIVLERESGETLETIVIDEDIIGSIQQEADEQNLKCLSFIDLYGDTIFNNAQSREIIEECDKLKKFKSKESLQVLDKIKNLAERCSKEIHTYLKFLGN